MRKLTEKFIDEHQDKVDWHEISYCQRLSESFIEKFKDKVEWDEISRLQTLSKLFIIKMKAYIDFSSLLDENLMPNVINNCYQYIESINKRKLKHKDILPEVKLFYGTK